MIISRSPYRISFFGGGTDYPIWYEKYKGEVISATIDKFLYLSLRKLPAFHKHKYRIVYSKTEVAKKIEDLKFKVVKEIIKNFKIKDGLELHYDGDLPSRSGMGSSSVFVVGLINLFNAYLGKTLTSNQLANDSLNFEHKVLKELVGSQDQIATSYGGFNSIKFYKNQNFSVSKLNLENKFLTSLNKNLVLIFTGISRTARIIANNYVKKLTNEKKNEMLNLLELVDEAKKIMSTKNIQEFGKLMHESWIIKKKISKHISSRKLDDIYAEAIKQGAIGGKLLGAGGGGFFLFYVPEKKQKNFLKNYKKIVKIDFKFTNEKSSIIYNSNA